MSATNPSGKAVHRHSSARWRLALALGGFSWAFSGSAQASENYPAIIDRQKGVECPRPLTRCLICHDTAAGGEGSANRPFALALVDQYGLSGGKAGRELVAALELLPDDVDTDGDGAPDQEELALCMNPSGAELSEGPGYGCSLPAARRSSAPLAPWLLALILALAARRRTPRQGLARRWEALAFGADPLRWTFPLLCTCTPTEIAEDRFQSRAQTCYEFPAPGDAGVERAFGSGLVRRDGCDAAGAANGGSGATPPGAASAGAAAGGSGAAAPSAPGAGVGGAPGTAPPSFGAEGSDAGAPIGTGGTPAPASPLALPANCSEAAVLAQLSRPYDSGGCTDPGGTGCHEDGTGEEPILQYPDQIVGRLLDREDADGCGEVWIPSGAMRPEDSFFWRRLSQNVSDEDCEIQMPLDEDPLDPSTLACISAWIVWVANGRPE